MATPAPGHTAVELLSGRGQRCTLRPSAPPSANDPVHPEPTLPQPRDSRTSLTLVGRAGEVRPWQEHTPETSSLIARRGQQGPGRPLLWGERACLRIGVSRAPVGERDEESTPTTFSRIKIEPFI